MTLLRLSLVLSALLISGCSTTMHEPSDSNSTMVVGTLVLEAAHFQRAHNASVNGRTGKDIEITVENLDTRVEQTITTTGQSGLFHFAAEPDVYYRIKKVFYKSHGTRGSWQSIWNHPRTIFWVTDSDVVHNLGHLAWQADKRAGNYGVQASGDYQAVRDRFESRYSKSEWLDKHWVEQTF